MSKPKLTGLKRLSIKIPVDEEEEDSLGEDKIIDKIIENILQVYKPRNDSDKINTSNTITKLYDIIDLNKPNVNTVENINKIIEVYKKEVYIQEKYIEAVNESNLNDQIYIPKIIDHGIIFVKDNNNESLPNDIELVKSFGNFFLSKQKRPIDIGLGEDNPHLKRYFFKYNVENMSKENDNKIYDIIFEREGIQDGKNIVKSFSLFYFIQMETVPDEYEEWGKFTDWSNKSDCESQLSELINNLQQEISDRVGYFHGDINSTNIFVKKEKDKYKYALIDFGEATDTIFEEKITLRCPSDEELFEQLMTKTKDLGGKKKTKRNRINKKRKTYKHKKTKTNKNINKKNKTKKQFLYNPDDPKKSFDVYIDKDPTDTIPIKYTTIDDVKTTIKTLEKLYKQNKYPHKRIWQVGMIMKVRLEAMLKHKDKLYPNAKNVNSRFDLANKYFLFLRSRTKEKDEKKRKEMEFNH